VSDLDQGVIWARAQIVPKLKEHDGFDGAVLIVDRPAQVAFGITFWRTEEDLAASAEDEEQIVNAAAQAFDVQVNIRGCEVPFSTFASMLTN
jgi:hypothetical protein